MRSALAANTSIKYAAGVSAQDAHFMAKDMYCDPSFIMAQRKTGDQTEFACLVRNLTPHAISLTVPLSRLSAEPRMTDAAHERLLARNRERVSVPPARQPTQASQRPNGNSVK